MKRIKFTKALDVIVVEDPVQIRALANDDRIDRQFDLHPAINSVILKRTLNTLSFLGVRFPAMAPKADTVRSQNQDELWDKCNLKAAVMESGSETLAALANWVQGDNKNNEPGILVQQVVGSIFSDQFHATEESWAAALTLDAAIRSKNIPKMLWWKITGKVTKAKRLLSEMVNNDLSGVHGTGVALHNIVTSIRLMRTYYADEQIRRSLTPGQAADRSLSAPPVILRQARAAGEVSGCPFSKYSLLLLKLGEADKNNQSKDLIFMTSSWSCCPAEKWVSAVLAGVWKRAAV